MNGIFGSLAQVIRWLLEAVCGESCKHGFEGEVRRSNVDIDSNQLVITFHLKPKLVLLTYWHTSAVQQELTHSAVLMTRRSPVGLGFYFQSSALTSDEQGRHRRIYHQNCANFSGNEM